jgi:quinol monooxygenase YgiN
MFLARPKTPRLEPAANSGVGRGPIYGTLTRIDVKPGKRLELLDYLRWDAQVTKDSEPGTWRFDVWEVEEEADVVYLYEAYKDRAAFDEHMQHGPHKQWNEMVLKTMKRVTKVIPFTDSVATNMDE